MRKLLFPRPLMHFLCLLLGSAAIGQTPCGFDQLHRNLLNKDAAYRTAVEEIPATVKAFRAGRMASTLATVYRIPVVVHVIHRGETVGTGSNISDAQIQSAITSLSQYYRATLGNSVDAEIEFELASLDPDCNATTGIERIDGSGVTGYSTNGLTTGDFSGTINETDVKNLSRWPNQDYYNIWVVAEINNNNAGSGIQGFAYFPNASPTVDGTVILYNAFGYDPDGSLGYSLKSATNLNKVITHEMGHAFGLFHSFQGDDSNGDGVADQCPSNTDCSTEGDQVCDTDPHQRSLSNCPSGTNTCTGNPLSNIVTNYMDYSSEDCQDRFTAGQVSRMRAVIDIYRSSLTTSRALNTTPPASFSAPVAASCTPATSAGGLTNHYAGIMEVNLTDITNASSTARGDDSTTGYLDMTTDCQRLIELAAGNTYTLNSTVLAVNNEQLAAWIDFDNNGTFEADEQIYFNASIPAVSGGYVAVSGNFNIPSDAVTNVVLRMRVMDDLTTDYSGVTAIADGCQNPTYGQAEDYSVYIAAALPVKLLSFTGRRNGTTGILSWESTYEKDLARYELEKSTDGTNFNRIASLAAKNASTGARYEFTDPHLDAPVQYYRLRQVDQNGATSLSQVVTINMPVATPWVRLQENPVTDALTLVFGQLPAPTAGIRLTDMLGRLLYRKQAVIQDGQSLTIRLSSIGLRPGTYLLQVQSGTESRTEKVVVY